MADESWDDPVKCAEFIEIFTSHIISDVRWFDLTGFSRNDLERIIQLLHGYYSHFVSDCPPEIREDLMCSAEDVLKSIAMASSISESEDGEMILSDELWEIVRKNPILLKYFTNRTQESKEN